MNRVLAILAAASIALGTSGIALGQSGGGGNSSDAPGQERATEQCEAVWMDIQADLRAGGGPKSGPVADIPEGTGPTNCDHFWQSEGVIGNG